MNVWKKTVLYITIWLHWILFLLSFCCVCNQRHRWISFTFPNLRLLNPSSSLFCYSLLLFSTSFFFVCVKFLFFSSSLILLVFVVICTRKSSTKWEGNKKDPTICRTKKKDTFFLNDGCCGGDEARRILRSEDWLRWDEINGHRKRRHRKCKFFLFSFLNIVIVYEINCGLDLCWFRALVAKELRRDRWK